MGWGSYYLFWLIAPMVIALVSAHPSVLVVILIAFLARRWIPDPYLFFKHARRVGALRNQIAVNADNATARRDLALIYLEKRRPQRAVPLLEEALRRDPDSAELHYLLGLAQLRAKHYQAALEPLVAAVARNEKLRYGDPYLHAGDALERLGRLDEAEDAYERFLKINPSSLEGWCKLAAVRAAKRDAPGRKQALHEAVSTYQHLPGFHRRKQWLWYLRARVSRLGA
ncbi:MAG TPA: tetratricopeptide repeat protein [Polyangia bacterium]|nr:tetratricopeptide repeat protein [Polyangia bacterium]